MSAQAASLSNCLSSIPLFRSTIASLSDKFIDAETMLGQCAEGKRSELHQSMQALLTGLNQAYYLPSGKQPTSSCLNFIVWSTANPTSASVVYIRNTDTASVYSVLIRLKLDLGIGTFTSTEDSGTSNAIPTQPAQLTPLGSMPFAGQLDTASSVSVGDVAFTIASSLVWALPPNWAPAAAAVVGVLELFFGSSSDAFGQALQEATTELEEFMVNLEIKENLSTLKQFTEWLNLQIAVLGGKVTDDVDNVFLLGIDDNDKGFLGELRDNVSAGQDNVYKAIYNLENFLDTEGVFDIYVLGISLYLLGLKMILQTEAIVATNYQKLAQKAEEDASKAETDVEKNKAKQLADDYAAKFADYSKKWTYDYNLFEIAIYGDSSEQALVTGWADKITDKIKPFRQTRLSQIQKIYKPSDDGKRWAWYDNDGIPSEDKIHWIDARYIKGHVFSSADYFEYHYKSKVNRIRRINEVNQSLDDKYANAQNSAKKWLASIYEWNEHQVPPTPSVGPEIDPNGWRDKPPTDSNWKSENKVSYAIKFNNDCGSSKLGPYCDPVQIQADKACTLINLPEDSSKMATKRFIYRKITDANGTVMGKEKLVHGGSIQEQSYEDNSK